MFRIGGDGTQRLRRGPKENPVHHGLILIGNGGDLVGDGKDDMIVLHGQQFGPPLLQPLGFGQGLALGTVPIPAGVVGNAALGTVVTLFDVTAQGRGPTLLNGPHHPALAPGERGGVFLPIGCPIAVEDVSKFERRPHERLPPCLGQRGQQIERTGCRTHGGGGHVGIAGGRGQAAMPEQELDRAHVRARFEQVGRKAMA
jgi:hypothetical protein